MDEGTPHARFSLRLTVRNHRLPSSTGPSHPPSDGFMGGIGLDRSPENSIAGSTQNFIAFINSPLFHWQTGSTVLPDSDDYPSSYQPFPTRIITFLLSHRFCSFPFCSRWATSPILSLDFTRCHSRGEGDWSDHPHPFEQRVCPSPLRTVSDIGRNHPSTIVGLVHAHCSMILLSSSVHIGETPL